LKQLMKMPELQDLSLVGGTALSLLYGHRKSDDLDFFQLNIFFYRAKNFTTLRLKQFYKK